MHRLSVKLFFAFCVVIWAVLLVIGYFVQRSISANYLLTLEEGMFGEAKVLAASTEAALANGKELGELESLFRASRDAQQTKLRHFHLTAREMETRYLLYDEKGTVLFDSNMPSRKGENFSAWRDVRRALGGGYGARTTINKAK